MGGKSRKGGGVSSKLIARLKMERDSKRKPATDANRKNRSGSLLDRSSK